MKLHVFNPDVLSLNQFMLYIMKLGEIRMIQEVRNTDILNYKTSRFLNPVNLSSLISPTFVSISNFSFRNDDGIQAADSRSTLALNYFLTSVIGELELLTFGYSK